MVSLAFISIDRLSCIIGSPTMSKHGRTATTPHFSAPYILSLLNTKTPRAAFFIRQPFGPAATNGVMADNMELFKQFQDNPSFKKWLSDMVFNLTYEPKTDKDAKIVDYAQH